ncbi:MAG: peptide-methionine (R)-S-oxide reductase MsrB [Porticoccus sp.]|nr:peptide-methionine (R)-S-oxide reductase MsrB [Porticoccus sp.]MBQ0807851.1 peptide-methionine (R)-S-oxide reductase MsrB [Porticoccus sp.]MDX2350235.1 peptide-methionine (R)-S-oxide reductase MsrB [Porticoccus sp.]
MSNDQEMNDEYWREKLTDEEFYICRQKGTEPAFSGQYCHETAAGSYLCRCCREPVFHSSNKYDSGSGWASFYQPVNSDTVTEYSDPSYGMDRIETICANCGSHLGHVFNDGPEPTGLRYCTNSVSLLLEKE